MFFLGWNHIILNQSIQSIYHLIYGLEIKKKNVHTQFKENEVVIQL